MLQAIGPGAVAAARLAGAGALLHRRVGENGAGLSAGEVRRVALARPAPLLLLDEPTAHLDDAAARELLTDVLDDADGAGILLITHRPPPPGTVDEVVHLNS